MAKSKRRTTKFTAKEFDEQFEKGDITHMLSDKVLIKRIKQVRDSKVAGRWITAEQLKKRLKIN